MSLLAMERADTFVRGSGLAATWQAASPEEAARLAKTHFVVAGRMTRFASEKDDTFRILSDDGAAYVFKLCNPEEDPGAIDFQNALLDHVARTDPTLPVPRVIRSWGKVAAPVIVDDAGQARQLRLLTYLDGVPLDQQPISDDQAGLVGTMLARLRLAMAEFAHEADSPEIAWDVRHAQRLRPLAREIEHAERRAMVEEGFERLAAFDADIGTLRRQVVHNDFSRSNIVVADETGASITGIIDFGDAARTAIAIDVSTALLNHLPRGVMSRTEDIFGAGRALLAAYLLRADLSETERQLLPHLVMGRILVRTVLTTWRAHRMPHNATYILRNTDQGWAQLDWFLSRSVDQVSALLLANPGI